MLEQPRHLVTQARGPGVAVGEQYQGLIVAGRDEEVIAQGLRQDLAQLQLQSGQFRDLRLQLRQAVGSESQEFRECQRLLVTKNRHELGTPVSVDIIVLLNSRRRVIRVSLNPVGVGALSLCLALLLGAMFHGGSRYAEAHLDELVGNVRSQTASMWQQELDTRQQQLQAVRVNAEKSLDAMATRLSLLQGHVMRLDALGSRLASMADLKDMQFGFDSPPGIGGPAPEFTQEAIDVSDLLSTLTVLEAGLEEKAEMLSAMESMLIDRTLREQTLPDGTPAAGAWVSSLFGFRSDPVTGRREFHQGLDLAGRPDTPIAAVAAGIVTWSGIRYGYGEMVEISHGNGYLTRYAHNRKNLVAVGERVEKGEIIALMGSSGRSTGTHVHFEVVRYGTHVDPRRHIALP